MSFYSSQSFFFFPLFSIHVLAFYCLFLFFMFVLQALKYVLTAERLLESWVHMAIAERHGSTDGDGKKAEKSNNEK